MAGEAEEAVGDVEVVVVVGAGVEDMAEVSIASQGLDEMTVGMVAKVHMVPARTALEVVEAEGAEGIRRGGEVLTVKIPPFRA